MEGNCRTVKIIVEVKDVYGREKWYRRSIVRTFNRPDRTKMYNKCDAME